MMTPMYDIVLVAVMIVQNSAGSSMTLEYQPLDYFNSWSRCYQEEKRLSRTKDKRTGYICVKVSKD
jgi:hypothetical protein